MERQLEVSKRIQNTMGVARPLFEFFTGSTWSQRAGEAGISDFAFGNPHDMPLPGLVRALERWTVPQNKDWYAYKMSERVAQEAVAAALQERRGVPFDVDDIRLTTGAFSGLSVALNIVVNPGDEVIFISPPWFFYEALITATGGKAVRVPINSEAFDLDIEAIAAAITPQTRAIIINSPNNPTGKIYPPETLQRLSALLSEGSNRNGRPIYLLSDEAYSRIVFDQQPYYSPTTYYPYSFLIYTYGKTLLSPGERLGYLALPPTMPHREEMRLAITTEQLIAGHAFPNAILQYALPDLEQITIDIEHLQKKRDRMVYELRQMGYEVHVPQGTFYLLPRSPIADDMRFIELLAEENVFCLPGKLVELPGYFRISLTANDEMIERGLPGFAAARRKALQLKG
ncbi:MAG: aminotransferase class I/II-fold pyridoxal phosphate-dependent enzyme [Chloroflexi bacterium]|nr:aminotransferase class I/II-fold pyridoxal phosphate-dependent enzyme [Chloroflexota bacterium]